MPTWPLLKIGLAHGLLALLIHAVYGACLLLKAILQLVFGFISLVAVLYFLAGLHYWWVYAPTTDPDRYAAVIAEGKALSPTYAFFPDEIPAAGSEVKFYHGRKDMVGGYYLTLQYVLSPADFEEFLAKLKADERFWEQTHDDRDDVVISVGLAPDWGPVQSYDRLRDDRIFAYGRYKSRFPKVIAVNHKLKRITFVHNKPR